MELSQSLGPSLMIPVSRSRAAIRCAASPLEGGVTACGRRDRGICPEFYLRTNELITAHSLIATAMSSTLSSHRAPCGMPCVYSERRDITTSRRGGARTYERRSSMATATQHHTALRMHRCFAGFLATSTLTTHSMLRVAPTAYRCTGSIYRTPCSAVAYDGLVGMTAMAGEPMTDILPDAATNSPPTLFTPLARLTSWRRLVPKSGELFAPWLPEP